MMRSPYQSPKDPPAQRFLRLPPRETSRPRTVLVWAAAAVVVYLAYSFIGGDSGLLRIRALRNETAALQKRKVYLASEAERAEQIRKSFARDPLLEERVARERFHLVKKDEILYRYPAEEAAGK